MKKLDLVGVVMVAVLSMGNGFIAHAQEDPQIIDDPGVFVPDKVKNVDVDAMAEQIDRFTYEMAYSESASTTSILEYDYENFVMWAQDLRTGFELMCTQPPARANWGQSRERMYQITFTMEEYDEGLTPNLGIRYSISFLWGILSNMTRSESANISNGMLAYDCNNAFGALDKFENLLLKYDPAARSPQPQSSNFARQFNIGGGQ